jgi:hypothetical protein
MQLYKLTDQKGQTHDSFQWTVGTEFSLKPKASPELCSPDVFHVYRDPNLALLLNPIHADIKEPLLWQAQGDVVIEDWGKAGCFSLQLTEQLPLPEWYVDPKLRCEVQVRFARLCAETAARAAARAADAAKVAAARAAAAAKVAAARAARAAAWAADAARAAAATAAKAAWAAEAEAAAAWAARAARAADAAWSAAAAADAAAVAGTAFPISFASLAKQAISETMQKSNNK